jgi:hypothetical protein
VERHRKRDGGKETGQKAEGRDRRLNIKGEREEE